jgi:hypothetical protein
MNSLLGSNSLYSVTIHINSTRIRPNSSGQTKYRTYLGLFIGVNMAKITNIVSSIILFIAQESK